MPHCYSIDEGRQRVVLRAIGPLTDDDVRVVRRQIANDPAFDPSYDHLIDLANATEVPFDYWAILAFADRDQFEAGSQRAIIVGSPAQYTVARTFHQLCRVHADSIGIFQAIGDAERWLCARRGDIRRPRPAA